MEKVVYIALVRHGLLLFEELAHEPILVLFLIVLAIIRRSLHGHVHNLQQIPVCREGM